MALERSAPALALALGLMAVTVTGAGCAPQDAPAADAQPEYTTSATIKDIMQGIIDPAADAIWLSVMTEVSAEGTVETVPGTDEEWDKVRFGAITLIEASNLLMIPGRPVARPGEKSETPGVELEPPEMAALINEDRAAWNARARQLHDVGLEAMKAAEARDPQRIFDVGEHIENACEACHSQYWYPNEQIPPILPEPPA